MQGIITHLDELNTVRMYTLWQELGLNCDLAGIFETPIPHFSWHLAAEYDKDGLEEVLTKLVRDVRPFMIRTNGIGIFTGSSPVIYIPIVKDISLMLLHERLWKKVQSVAINPVAYYSPDGWMPHITVAYGDIPPEKLRCAIDRMAVESFKWEIKVDNLTVYQVESQGFHLMMQINFNQ